MTQLLETRVMMHYLSVIIDFFLLISLQTVPKTNKSNLKDFTMTSVPYVTAYIIYYVWW